MSRMLFVARALWVAMLLLATPLAVLAQAPLTGEYVSASGLSLSYPGDWIVQEEAGIVALSNDPTAFDSDGLPPGAVGVLILEPPTVKTLASGAAETPEDMLKSFAAELSGGELDAATLAPQATTLGDRPAARLDASYSANDVLLVALDFGDAGPVIVAALALPGELSRYEDTILALAATIEYTSPWRALFQGHTDYVNSVAFSPDGARLVSASDDYTARVWEVASGAELLSLEHPNYVYSAVFSPDGSLIATGGADGIVRLWDAATGASVAELTGHTDYVRSVVFSPSGNLIASGSDDYSVRLWAQARVRRGQQGVWQEKAVLSGHTDWIRSIAISADGSLIASGGDDATARVWDVASGAERLVIEHPDWVRAVALSPDGSLLVTGSDDGRVRIWDAASGASVADLAGHTDYVNGVAFSPDGSLIASGSDDDTVRLWALTVGWQEAGVLSGHVDWVNGVAFSPDGSLLASVSDDGNVILWDVAG